MNGKQVLLDAIDGKAVPRVPWVPFAGVHAGALKGYTATEILKDGDKLFECLEEVHRLYMPDGMPVMFDLQLEAEIMGCKLRWADKAPPSVEQHPLSSSKEVPDTIPSIHDGRLPLALDVMKRCKDAFGDDTALFGLVTGPLTLASHLRGTKIFMDLIKDKNYFTALLNHATVVGNAIATMYIDAGMDVIAVVDPIVSQVSPRMFNKMLAHGFASVFDHVRNKGIRSAFFVCGDATKNIEPMCHVGTDSIFVDENVDLSIAKQVTDAHGITIGGNIPLTSVMLYGTQQDNMKYVIDEIETLGSNRLVIAPGCDMPYDVPPENVIGAAQATREPVKVRAALAGYEASEGDIDVELPDYESLDHLLIEVFTIDSATCAACGYMARIALSVLGEDEFAGRVRVVEYKAIDRENISRARAIGIKHLPCMLFNGSLQYSSIIPSDQEYFSDVRMHLSRIEGGG